MMHAGGERSPACLHDIEILPAPPASVEIQERFDGVFVPLIPSVKNNIQKAENLIPEMASPGWIRGGLPSRSYIRDVNC